MGRDINSILEEKLIDRLSALKVQGDVVDKRVEETAGSEIPQKFLLIRFKDREFEKPVENAEFEQTKIGDTAQFSPPIPECDECNCHLWVCVAFGIVVGACTVWAIINYFSGRTALLLSLTAAGWISIIVWAMNCSQNRKKFLKDLEEELRFFEK